MKTWLITGCSSGIGMGIAKAVLNHGNNAVITARDINKLDDFTKNFPDRALSISLDVAGNESINSALDSARKRFGKIDVLVNNAGFGYRSLIEEGDSEIISQLFRVHVFGAFELIRRVLPDMKASKSGAVINILSIGGVRSAINNGWYSASKGAPELMSDAPYKEVRNYGVKVLIVKPGAFRTNFYNSIKGTDASNEINQPGNPDKAVEIIADVIEREDCPERLLLGSDAVKIIRSELEARLSELEKFSALSSSSDY